MFFGDTVYNGKCNNQLNEIHERLTFESKSKSSARESKQQSDTEQKPLVRQNHGNGMRWSVTRRLVRRRHSHISKFVTSSLLHTHTTRSYRRRIRYTWLKFV